MNRISGPSKALAVCLGLTLCLPARGFAADTTPDAQKVMEDVYRQDTNHDIVMKASFLVFDAQGHSVKKEFYISADRFGGRQQDGGCFYGAEGDSRGCAARSESAGAAGASVHLYAGDGSGSRRGCAGAVGAVHWDGFYI